MAPPLPQLACRVALAAALFAPMGCTVPVAVDLDEAEAHRVVLALNSRQIGAERSIDPSAEGRFRVEVARDEAARAEGALAEDGLPRPKVPSLLDALDTGALVPSRMTEQARLLAGVSGELERSLGGVDGVLSARVHLAAPRTDPLAGDGEPSEATASVLIRHRGTHSPLSDADVQRLVSGAVPGLAPARVAVIHVAVPGVAGPTDLVRLGPVSTTRASARKVRAAIAFVALLNVALVACLITLWLRVRKHRQGPRDTGARDAREPR